MVQSKVVATQPLYNPPYCSPGRSKFVEFHRSGPLPIWIVQPLDVLSTLAPIEPGSNCGFVSLHGIYLILFCNNVEIMEFNTALYVLLFNRSVSTPLLRNRKWTK